MIPTKQDGDGAERTHKRTRRNKQKKHMHLPQEAGLLGSRARAAGDTEEGDAAAKRGRRSVAALRPELRLAKAEGRVEREAESGLQGQGHGGRI